MPIVTLPFAEWAPDLFPIGSPGAATITNVIPRTPTTYGSVPTMTAYSGGLLARAIGSYTVKDTAKNVNVFAGDRVNLYLLKAGSTNFADVSSVALYSGAPWPDTQWSFTSFGLRVVAANYNDPTQSFLVGTDSLFSALAGPVVTTGITHAGPVTTTGDTHTNTTLDNLGTTVNVVAGMDVTGAGIAANTKVLSVDGPTSITLDTATTATASGVSVTFSDGHATTTLSSLGTTTNVRPGMIATGGSIPANTIVISVDGTEDVTISQSPTTTAYSVPITFTSSVPRAKYVEAVGDFLMLANTFDGTSGAQPQRVWWSGIGDSENFPLPGSVQAIQVQSDYQDLQQTDLGQITGIAAGPLPTASATIFCEKGVYTALYVGSPAIFSFKAVDGAPGCVASTSIVKGHLNSGGTVAPVIFYRSADGFYAFNGTSSVSVGANKVDRFVLSELDPRLDQTVLGVAAQITKVIYWFYSTTGSAGLYNRAVAYNWDVNRWSYIDLSSTPVEWVAETATIGYTLEELDQFGTLETLRYSLDSEAWVGGAVAVGAFNSSHQLAYFSGSNMAPTVETPEVEPIPGSRVFIRNARPLVDATNGSIAISTRERQADSLTLKTAVLMNAMGECPQRVTGRYVKARFTFPAGTSFTHISGVEVDAIKQGIR